ncbi:MAG: outer membrane lipoprotein carrier protein LolA [Holophagae bacterium]|jgi:hypothetical protein
MRFRRRIVAVVASGLVAGGGVVSGQGPATDRLEALANALSRQPSWTADYRQEYVPAGMTLGEQAAGQVWVAWPDRALFHTGDPVVRLMGLDGRVARLVDLEAGSCDEHRLSDREWERFPLAALLDPEAASQRFDLAEQGTSGIVLRPREVGGIDRLEVTLNDAGLPVEVVIVDPQGATNRLGFLDWRPSAGPPSGAWLPGPPSGMTCVTDPGPLE